MDFDLTHTAQLSDGSVLEYGVVCGSEQIVLIKSGKGGTHRGEDDKYLQMARRLHRGSGCSVICSSNPAESAPSFEVDRCFIEDYVTRMGWSHFSLSLIGSSNGAYQNLCLAQRVEQTEKLLCINMPLMVNFHRTAAMLRSMDAIEKILVYGTRDPSIAYLSFVERWSLPRCRVLRAEGADHTFTGQADRFVALADLIG